MTDFPIQTISAIVGSERRLEFIINKLIQQSVAHHNISVQGSSTEITEAYGRPYVSPSLIQNSQHPPKRESFLLPDFGWILGFSFSIPFIICVIVAIFIIGDVRSLRDNFLYGILGLIVGSLVGGIVVRRVKKHLLQPIFEQEKKGGFVLWVTASSPNQAEEIVKLLKKYHAQHIKMVTEKEEGGV